MRLFIITVMLLFLCPQLRAESVPPHVWSEITALLTILQRSGCEFSRNGSWYTAEDARNHLLRKLEYLEGRNAVESSESFIELGASTSSTSGKPYLVKCGTAQPVESKSWLLRELVRFREETASRPH